MLVEVADLTQFMNEVETVKAYAMYALGGVAFLATSFVALLFAKPKVDMVKVAETLNKLQIKKGG